MVEERSMQVLLDDLLPRLLPRLRFQCIPHEGKQDLEKSIPRKLKAWREPGVHFVILRDADGADCKTIKNSLVELCVATGRRDFVVRIVCQELESWYLGDPAALARVFEDDGLLGLSSRERFRDPDVVVHPAKALEELVPGFQKVGGARAMARELGSSNRSRSFMVFLETMARLQEKLSPPD
jgi:hypothetical protein